MENAVLMKKKEKTKSSITYPRIVVVGFALLILVGSVMLSLPISTKTGGVSYIDALFTATSATCITGLVPFDTFSNWTVFGQIVIICLIQIGGLGFITILSIISHLIRRRMGLKEKMLLKESVGSINIGNVKKLSRSAVMFTACCELVGAVILSARFVPLAGWKRGIYMSVFTSISAFCNAGFDLMGMFSASSSLTTVNDDPVILITVMLLIVFGGLGFFVWEDMRENKFQMKRFSLHTRLVLFTTAVLVFGSAALFLVLENNASFEQMSLGKKILNAFFCSITPRTAGFNSVDIPAMSNTGKLLTMLLMFIGGSTGSTAGGVKTSTVAVIFICAVSTFKNKEDIELFGRRIDFRVLKSAVSICLVNLLNIIIASFVISINQGEFALLDVIFECTSAMGTVGITAGITPDLNTLSMIVIIVLMYIGRLTSLIFALSFVVAKPTVTTRKPLGKLMVG